MDGNDDFMLSLRQDALDAMADEIAAIQEVLIETFRAEPTGAIRQLMKHLHNIKGNLQAVGLQQFASLIHEMEFALTEVDKVLGTYKGQLSAEDAPILEFLLSDAVENLNFYRQDIKGGREDSDAVKAEKAPAIEILKSWSPLNPVVAAPAATAPESEDAKVIPIHQGIANVAAESASGGVSTQSPDRRVEVDEKPGIADYLICQICERQLAIPVSEVIEVVKWSELTQLPRSAKRVLGVISHFGEVIPVIDLFGAEEKAVYRFIIVTRIRGQLVGLGAHGVDQVVTLDASDFQTFDMAGTGVANALLPYILLWQSKAMMVVNLSVLDAA